MTDELLWETNYHYMEVNEESIFSHCTVSHIFVLEESIAEGASSPSILAKDSKGIKFRGNRKNYYSTELEAWAAIRVNLEEIKLFNESEIALLQANNSSIDKFLFELNLKDDK